jgi:lipopolysaccharide transport system ATP-binding protein
MSDTAIRVERVSKQYRIGKREKYKTLRGTLTDAVAAPVRRLWRAFSAADSGREQSPSDIIWALKDISFEIPRGAVVGIIGPNGAGKSTLLKILSRITEPTEGYAEVRGRVGSLLEVGTGFHGELTGRENIYLNGAILGMKKAEIERKFDEIVAFAEVERFIDTPVKHYSSGMYVRLAFAVAAHMEPDILIVDEVLAVGDQRFQEKCLNRMGEVGKRGRTIIFVSHSMPSIQRLCERVIVLENGVVRMDAAAQVAVAEYLSGPRCSTYLGAASLSAPVISRAHVEQHGGCLVLSVDFESPFPLTPPVFGFVMYDPVGNPVYGTNTLIEPPDIAMPPASSGRIEVVIPTGHLRPNRYLFSLWLGDAYLNYCELPRILQAEVNGVGVDLPSHVIGSLRLPVEWRFWEASSTLEEAVSSSFRA